MRLKKWVRVVLTIILVIAGAKLYFASNDFSTNGNTTLAILCWYAILIPIPFSISKIWE